MSRSTDQVPRLLSLVPFLTARPGTTIAEAAEAFGVSPRQVEEDLDVLVFCGLPGQYGGSLIDVTVDGRGGIWLDNAEMLERPLRLLGSEALAVLVGLRTLLATTDLAPESLPAVERALAKVETALGDAADAAEGVTVVVEDVPPAVTGAVRRAIADGRRLHLVYDVAGRDERTERDVDPVRLAVTGGRAYLDGWCHRSGDRRTFRLDRIVSAEVLDVPVATVAERAGAAGTDDAAASAGSAGSAGSRVTEARRGEDGASVGAYRARPDDLRVVVRLTPAASWVAEYYPTEAREDLADGRTEATIATADAAWVRRLALRLGGELEVVAPADVRAAVRADALRALAAAAPAG